MSYSSTPPFTPTNKQSSTFPLSIDTTLACSAYQKPNQPFATTNSGQNRANQRKSSINDSLLSSTSNSLFDESLLSAHLSLTDDEGTYLDDSYYSPISPVELGASEECIAADFKMTPLPAALASTTHSHNHADTKIACATEASKNLLHELQRQSPKTAQPSQASLYKRYPLKNEELEQFVIGPVSGFTLALTHSLGAGSNSYVQAGKLSLLNKNNIYSNPTDLVVAVKIPKSKNKVKFIESETEFMLSLRRFQLQLRQQQPSQGKNDNLFPFIDAYGLYYLNKTQFPMIKRTDELPALVLSKMDMTLDEFIQMQLQNGDNTSLPTANRDLVAIGTHNWWTLTHTLLKALTILKMLNSVHCDLKSENLMVNLTPQGPVFKLIDFSSSCKIDQLEQRGMPEMTLQFTPPELLQIYSSSPDLEQQLPMPSFQTDLFSAGLIVLHAATGSLPYAAFSYDQFYLAKVVSEGKVLDCLTKEDANRLTSDQAVKEVIIKIIRDRADLSEVLELVEKLSPFAGKV
ncbi:unnamed protein product [Ambrosiozyma monospora]|uniref:Unnamed protein product n=1 Tax=Ambrosiozyma monospora TaxID=43982 RepID=A0A9W6YSB2_AMBMO|nr:unnamed protein product [Ambrosiozyma monospora]